jgi:hypothetical protein
MPMRKATSVSLIMAGASLLALLAQAAMGLVMVGLFTPSTVGSFASIAQVAFFWTTIALAHAPLQLLANTGAQAEHSLGTVLKASFLRWLFLLVPIAILIEVAGIGPLALLLPWAALLAISQLLWYLAQAWALRTGPPISAALSRAAPPLLALALASAWGIFWPQGVLNGLLLATACGYALGATWLIHKPASATPEKAAPKRPQTDDRSSSLRIAHALSDAVAGTALLLVWQHTHGATETGFLAALLRLLSFTPTIVHSAWAQVSLAQVRAAYGRSLAVGLGGALLTSLIAFAAWVMLQAQNGSSAWIGLEPYLLPLVLWQSGACVFAAFSHKPFQTGQASRYSQMAILFNAAQLTVLLLPAVGLVDWSVYTHLWWLSGVSAVGLFALAAWIVGIKLK